MTTNLIDSFDRAKAQDDEKNEPLTKPKVVDGRLVFERPNPTPEEAPY